MHTSSSHADALHIKLYYKLKPFLPRAATLATRTLHAAMQRQRLRKSWPIDPNAQGIPAHWRGWPEGKRFALVLTHDVDSARGVSNCRQLIEMETARGFRSGFFFTPERYQLPSQLRCDLQQQGFEVGLHGVLHDGKLYSDAAEFQRRAARINAYLHDWGCTGFRSPSMQHDLDMLHTLNIAYDASTFDTDPFQPQPTGVTRIFPFWVPEGSNGNGYMELPYTLSQDFTLFILLRRRDTTLWRHKLDWIVQHGGMAMLIVHPDYMNFNGKPERETYPASLYGEFLDFVQQRYAGHYWHALPREVADYCSPEPKDAEL